MQEIILLVLYLLISAMAVWGLVKMAEPKPPFPPKDDDGEGGIPSNGGLPLIDVPPGGSVDDLLVDRWEHSPVSSPKEFQF